MLSSVDAVLVIVDVQGRLASLMHDHDSLIANIRIMIQACQKLDIPILWNEQVPDKLGETVPEIAELLSAQSPMAKTSFSCLGSDAFNSALADTRRRQVLVVGIETHVCVYQTVVDLLENLLEVHVIADAVSSRKVENKKLALHKMRLAGADVTTTEMCLFEMLRTAEAEEFRDISRLVR
ncbi:hydrolase [Allohahella sp. A8]|uniref:hydrolase n=1 Tax=Allohahella sp. A8 TaxID=3141461 RepID=UPI000C0914DC|nr:hydrolase [Hahellaceae bacterium]|tara:strand:+ start:32248 stop:32787 length:540 start_codon:yes stop_codon:yes gene_type:complete